MDSLIRQEIESAVREHLSANRDELKAAVTSAMGGHLDKVASSVVDSLVNNDWRANLSITIARQERD